MAWLPLASAATKAARTSAMLTSHHAWLMVTQPGEQIAAGTPGGRLMAVYLRLPGPRQPAWTAATTVPRQCIEDGRQSAVEHHAHPLNAGDDGVGLSPVRVVPAHRSPPCARHLAFQTGLWKAASGRRLARICCWGQLMVARIMAGGRVPGLTKPRRRGSAGRRHISLSNT